MPFSIVQVQGGQLALADADGNILAIITDGGAKKLATAARLHDGSTFYKATTPSDTQPISAVTLPLPAGAATETTLALIKAKTDAIPTDPAKESGKLTSLETILTAIRDTAGVKKITDALPAGTNNIGDVDLASPLPAGTNEIGRAAQGTKGAGSNAWPVVLYDASGNPLALDGSQRQIVVGAGTAGSPAGGVVTIQGGTNGTPVPVTGSGGGGSQQVEGRGPSGSTPVGNPVYVAGTDGTLLRSLLTDNQGRLVIAPAGTVSAQSGFRPGYVATAVISTVAVRATAYTEQTVNGQRSLASASANDSASGTGARTVELVYYDQSGNGPYTETVTLNGTTGVNTVATDICYVARIEVLTAGSGGVNAGVISLYSGINKGGVVVGSIAVGDNRTFWCHHYVPSGKITKITGVSVGHNGTTVGSGGLFVIRSKALLTANAAERQVSDFIRLYGQASTFSRIYGTAIEVVGPARLVVYVTPETSSSVIYRAAIDYYDQVA